MPSKSLKFGIIVDIQAALEMALGGGGGPGGSGGGGGLGGIGLNRINPVNVVREAHDRHGVKVIELPADANYIIPNILGNEDNVRGLQALRDELDLEYTMHLPFFNLHLCSFNEHVRKASVETQVETILAGEAIGGISNYVLHLTSELEDSIGSFNVEKHYKALAWGFFLDKGMSSLEEIIARTEVDPAKICVENNEGIPFSETYDILIDELGTSICLDVGHAVLQGEETPAGIFKCWGGRVHEVHLHNVLQTLLANRVRVLDDHRGIAEGLIDVDAFLDLLEEGDFSHPVLLEIMSQKEVAESLAYLRERGYC
ncbi:MAG: cobamide remodeling phosphodiesterase CbiR [Promethearchaeota archaeon]